MGIATVFDQLLVFFLAYSAGQPNQNLPAALFGGLARRLVRRSESEGESIEYPVSRIEHRFSFDFSLKIC